MTESPEKKKKEVILWPMEKELVRFGQEYSFSITQADKWLCEGLWVFLKEVRESLFLTQTTADRVTTFQNSEKSKMYKDAERSEGGPLSLPNHKMLITNLCTQRDFGPQSEMHEPSVLLAAGY